MEKITELSTLLDLLPACSPAEYIQIARQLELPTSELDPYLFWSDEHYTRNCIARTEKYELILICWEARQETPIHCHGGEECWVFMAEGALEETRYKLQDERPVPIENMELSHLQISYMNDNMGFHSLFNNTDKRALSLHLYMNPIDACKVYDSSQERFEARQLEYYSLHGKLVDEAVTL